ncbi:MAG: KamA family radical SAM protein [Proteobacteria bacterium]|nr:KamA family radical SAM protein [Pseudomonadota bacterium]
MKFKFFPAPKPSSVTSEQWNSWTWQLQKSLKTERQFAEVFDLTQSERMSFQQGSEVFNIRTTPYYASLCGEHSEDPIRKILMPREEELAPGLQQMLDPLGEKKNNPAPRIIHRYPDRVLFLVTDICSVYCRYCTRKHFTGQDQAFIRESDYQEALQYLQSHAGIREVILSGGDPLTLSDTQLERVLSDLREIEHLEIIRIGTRIPVVCPMRINDSFSKMLRKYAPVFLMTHFNHPKELTAESTEALRSLVDHGVPVFNQMVLLNGVNNHPAIVQALSRRLLYLRVKPYYMFQCDPSIGTDHLRTSLEDSLEIQKELWGNLSGLAMPNLSLDIPDGGGKAGYTPNFEIERTAKKIFFRGWDGVLSEYVNPQPETIVKPIDAAEYLPEWEQLKSGKQGPSFIECAPNERILPQIF